MGGGVQGVQGGDYVGILKGTEACSMHRQAALSDTLIWNTEGI